MVKKNGEKKYIVILYKMGKTDKICGKCNSQDICINLDYVYYCSHCYEQQFGYHIDDQNQPDITDNYNYSHAYPNCGDCDSPDTFDKLWRQELRNGNGAFMRYCSECYFKYINQINFG